MNKLTITQPDDWHIHLREDVFLRTTVRHAAERFGRVIVMPNLKPPVRTMADVAKYYAAIRKEGAIYKDFQPLMTLYLTDDINPDEISAAKESQLVFGCKLYPAGSTTHSDSGVKEWQKLLPVFEKMEQLDLPLLVHGEVTDPDIDIFDREARFIDQFLISISRRFPYLRIVLEHITTQDAVDFVAQASDRIAATITAHHLLLNRNDLFHGGIQPHHYCLPILKRRRHQEALIKAATSGQSKYFLGSDSAPHPKENKESACGCAGIYTAYAGIELYCEAFENAGALDKLETFASFNGADFYGLPRNHNKITLIKEDWEVPSDYPFGRSTVVPFRAGKIIHWKLVKTHE